MELIDYLRWILFFLLGWALAQGVHALLRSRASRVLRALNVILVVAEALLIFVFAYGIIGTTSSFWWNGAFFLGGLYCVFWGDVIAGVVFGIIRLVRGRRGANPSTGKHAVKQATQLRAILPQALASLVISAVVFTMGTVNMQVVQCDKYEIESPKLTQEHTFAFVADLHVGTSQQYSTLEDAVAQINAARPDFVILGGDVTDENSSAEDLQRAYDILKRLEPPTYWIYGNHDRQPDGNILGGRTYTDDQLVAAIQDAGFTMLVDEYVQVSDDLVLVGREDISAGKARQKASDLATRSPDANAFLLDADHQPYAEESDIAPLKADLQVSGHTHAGQIFPLRWLGHRAGLPSYGLYDIAGTKVIVSAGESGWAVPFRNEAHCSWDLITLKPSE